MKSRILFLILILFAFACSSPKHLIKNGKYDEAVKVLVKKLRTKPDNEKNIADLTYAYRVANQINHDSLNFLKQSGQPDIWYSIYTNYISLKQREELVKTLPDVVLQKIGFKNLDYSKDIENARKKAATYLYAHAEQLLDKNSKEDARRAYYELLKVSELYSDYRETDELLRKALVLGTDYILYEVENNAGYILPQAFIFDLQNPDLSSLDQNFIRIDNYPVKNRIYDYHLVLDLRKVLISPERVRENNYVESKKVVSDYKVKKDKDGNVIKDEEGNPVKEPVYKTISCHVTEFEKTKSAVAEAYLSFENSNTGRVINTTPITAETHFVNIRAEARGDMMACSERTLNLLNQPNLPFPTDNDLLRDLSEKINRTTSQIVWDDESYIN